MHLFFLSLGEQCEASGPRPQQPEHQRVQSPREDVHKLCQPGAAASHERVHGDHRFKMVSQGTKTLNKIVIRTGYIKINLRVRT